jgi:carbon monoxide dehydrogenase subunit G
MVEIKTSREMAAPLDSVWKIVSDVDNEPTYWHGTKSVKNLSRDGNVIDREVIISFKDSKCRQTVILEERKSVQIKILDGPLTGTKVISLSPQGDGRTRVDVDWNIKFAGFLGMFGGMVKKHIAEGTEEALTRIEKAAG